MYEAYLDHAVMRPRYTSQDVLLPFKMAKPVPLINAKTSMTGKRTKTTKNAQHAKGPHHQKPPETP
jgi:hypothetical protein